MKGRLSEVEIRSAGLLLVDFEPAYIRDVYVWLPDVRWGSDSMPCCPTCETAAHVGNHGFQSKHLARRYADAQPQPPPTPQPQASLRYVSA